VNKQSGIPVVEGQVVLSAEDAARTIQHLNEEIDRLNHRLTDELRRRPEWIGEGASDVLRHFRLHGIVLLNAGELLDDARVQEIIGNYPAMRPALEEAWELTNAPLSQLVKNQVKRAIDHGNRRW